MGPVSVCRCLHPLWLVLVSVAFTHTAAAAGPAKLDSATIARVYKDAAPAVVENFPKSNWRPLPTGAR